MIDDFRNLGGVADNVEQRRGQFGNGLFPIDPEKPIHLEVPEQLLIDDRFYILQGDELVVDPESGIAPEIAKFIAGYQQSFSWGADGRKHTEAFESSWKSMPADLIGRLKQLKLLNLNERHKGDWSNVLRQRFLQSRRIVYNERRVIMPIIELINHNARSKGYDIKNGIRVQGNYSDEITVCYSATSDAIIRFINYGFASSEPTAYSLPTAYKSDIGFTIQIGQEPGSFEKRDKLPLPKLEKKSEKLTYLSHLRLGIERMPRMPKTMLRKTLSDLPPEKTDELFDRVRNANIVALTDLLETTDGSDQDFVKEFRRALRFQLKALAYCYGVRNDI